jgi:DNA-binding CsgD family transcriptional regulator
MWKEIDFSLLSPREYEAAELIAQGNTFREIAKKMGVTPATAKRYRDNVIAKLSLRGTTHPSVLLAVGYALEKRKGNQNGE